jgi:hypothetical protein
MWATRSQKKRINLAAQAVLPILLRRWLPDGHLEGDEFVALNPTRNDRHKGSFKVNVENGLWADYATGDGGRGAISLVAYLFDLDCAKAAQRLAEMLEADRGA